MVESAGDNPMTKRRRALDLLALVITVTGVLAPVVVITGILYAVRPWSRYQYHTVGPNMVLRADRWTGHRTLGVTTPKGWRPVPRQFEPLSAPKPYLGDVPQPSPFDSDGLPKTR